MFDSFSFNRSETESLIVCINAFLTLVGKIDFCCSSRLEVKDEVVLNQSDCIVNDGWLRVEGRVLQT